MDGFAIEHLAEDPKAKWQISEEKGAPLPGESSYPIGVLTMGYYRQRDSLQFYRALADAFTVCDRYFCSVLGPTDPNRLMWMSGSLGAHSRDVGGPVLETYVSNREQMLGKLEWPTMPELLSDHGVSWKTYQDPSSNLLFDVMGYFKKFAHPLTATEVKNAALAFGPVYPAEFAADVKAGTLPQVSYLIPPAPCCEHPATPPEYGEFLVSEILQTLLLNPDVWEQSAWARCDAGRTCILLTTLHVFLPFAAAPGGRQAGLLFVRDVRHAAVHGVAGRDASERAPHALGVDQPDFRWL